MRHRERAGDAKRRKICASSRPTNVARRTSRARRISDGSDVRSAAASSRDIRLIIHHRRSIDRASAETRVGGNTRRVDDDLFIYLGDDGRRPRRLGRLGGDDGGERELGRERRGEHDGVDRSRCDDRSVVSFRSVVSVGRFGRFERVKRAAGGMMM